MIQLLQNAEILDDFRQNKHITVYYPRDVVSTDVIRWAGRRWLVAPAAAGTVQSPVSCEGDCRCERMPRVMAGSTDDDKDLAVPTDRVLVDVERLVDITSPLCLQHIMQ